MKKVILGTFLAILLLVVGCVKGDLALEQYQPTPYQFDLPSWAVPMDIPADNPTTVEGVALGRRLFYDTRLSEDNTMSCASCHVQEHAFSDNRRFSVGIDKIAGNRQSMAVFNLGWSAPLFWDGRAASLEAQAHDPVVNPIELHTTWDKVVKKIAADDTYPAMFFKAFGVYKVDSLLITKAIAQFERSIISFNSRFDKFYFQGDTTVFTAAEKRGKAIFFNQGSCLHCHADFILTDNALRNNGIDNEQHTDVGLAAITKNPADIGKFRVTTLRNIALTAPYMHDGRFATLEEVVEHYNSGIGLTHHNVDENMHVFMGGLGLTEQDKGDLVAFLKTLTDSTLITDKRYAKPE